MPPENQDLTSKHALVLYSLSKMRAPIGRPLLYRLLQDMKTVKHHLPPKKIAWWLNYSLHFTASLVKRIFLPTMLLSSRTHFRPNCQSSKKAACAHFLSKLAFSSLNSPPCCLYNFLHHKSSLSCSKRHSNDISYSRVFGWDKCDPNITC